MSMKSHVECDIQKVISGMANKWKCNNICKSFFFFFYTTVIQWTYSGVGVFLNILQICHLIIHSYSHVLLLAMLAVLSEVSPTSIAEIQQKFGAYIHGHQKMYHKYFVGLTSLIIYFFYHKLFYNIHLYLYRSLRSYTYLTGKGLQMQLSCIDKHCQYKIKQRVRDTAVVSHVYSMRYYPKCTQML